MTTRSICFLVSILLFGSVSNATEIHRAAPTAEQIREMERHNRQARRSEPNRPRDPVRAYVEFDPPKYLLMAADTNFDSAETKKKILEHLPAPVVAVILASDGSEAKSAQREFGSILPKERFVILNLNQVPGFWSRDTLPIPVVDSQTGKLILIDAKYFRGYEPDAAIADRFQSDLFSHPFYYEGGNFIGDSDQNCFLISINAAKYITDATFGNYYGCRKIHRLRFHGGIGHVDERIRLISKSDAVTDTPEYQALLESLGYRVHLLPRSDAEFETYANSLLIDKTLFMPTFNKPTDRVARELYESLGLTVVPLDSVKLSNRGLGSIHCITMTYPDADLKELAERLNAIPVP